MSYESVVFIFIFYIFVNTCIRHTQYAFTLALEINKTEEMNEKIKTSLLKIY